MKIKDDNLTSNDGTASVNLHAIKDKVAEPKFVGGLGMTGETWVDEKANRVLGTEYTNSTGKPIQLSIDILATTANNGSSAMLEIDGVVITAVYSVTTYANLYGSVITNIIPIKAKYKVTSSQGAVSKWFELK